VSFFKISPYRSPALLRLASGLPCLVLIAHDCRGTDGSTTVACHGDSHVYGKGRGLKASDRWTTWGCAPCHEWLGRNLPDKQAVFMVAMARQELAWREIVDNVAAKPWRVDAARGVLEHIALAQ
jgi:hypothetical protein